MDLLTPSGPRVCHGRERHCLFVLSAISRQYVLHLFKCTPQTSHVAMSENRVNARKEWQHRAVGLYFLRDKKMDNCLSESESDCLHREFSISVATN